MRKSIINKPNQLIKELSIPKSESLNSIVPKLESELELNISSEYMNKLGRVNIVPYFNNSLKLMNDERVCRISRNYKVSNSEFIIEKALNNKYGYISIRDINEPKRYLTYEDCCCYLFYKITKNFQ